MDVHTGSCRHVISATHTHTPYMHKSVRDATASRAELQRHHSVLAPHSVTLPRWQPAYQNAAAHTSWCDGMEPLYLFFFKHPKDQAVVVRNTCVRLFFFQNKVLIFLSTLVPIDSEGLKVIRTCGLLSVELISGRHTSKQCNRIS